LAQEPVDASDLLKNSEECKNVAEALADCKLVVGTTRRAVAAVQSLFKRTSITDPSLGFCFGTSPNSVVRFNPH
jgi:tRNA C32,U32 (ribose-2'-O)-methylase TrmJ